MERGEGGGNEEGKSDEVGFLSEGVNRSHISSKYMK